MRKTTLKRQMILAAAVLAGLGTTHAGAASLFWDVDGAGSAATGGTGTWTTAGTWRDGSATGMVGNWIDGSDAVLPNTAGTITLTDPVAANSLEFANPAGTYRIEGGTLTVPTIRLNSNTSQYISSTLSGPVTVVNNNPTAGAAGATTLSLAGTPAITTLTFGAGGTSFDKTNRVDFEATTTSNVSALNYTGITNINFDNNFGMLSASLPPSTGAEIHVNATVSSNVAGGYALLGSAAGARFHFNGQITGPGGVAFVATPNTATRTTGSGGAFVFNNPSNNYAGPTRFMMPSNGLLRSQIDNFLPVQNDVIFGGPGVSSVGGMNLNGMNVEIGSLTTEPGTTTVGIINNGAHGIAIGRSGNSIVTINGSANPAFASTTYSGPIGIPGGGNLDQIQINRPGTSTGTTTLTNANSAYSLGTIINGGAIISKNTSNNFLTSPVGVGPVTVGGTGTFGGSGQVIGAVSINGSGGHLAPGGVAAVDPTNPLDLQGGLTLDSGSHTDFDFFSAGSDRINTNTLTIPSAGLKAELHLNDDNGVGYSNGTFTLIDYDTLIGDFSFLNLATPADAPAGATFTLQQNAGTGAVEVVIAGAAANRTWTGAVNSAWDVGSPSTGTQNWSGPSKFFNGDFVTFDDSTGNVNVVIAAGGVMPGQMTVNTNNNYVFSNASGAVGITGPVNVNKQGGGTLTFNSPNSYTGGTTVAGGTLAFGPAGTAGTGAIALSNNSTIALTTGANIAGVPSVTLNNSTARADASLVTDRIFTLSGTSNIIDTPGTTMEISGVPSGTAKLIKRGSGTLKLSSAGSSMTGGIDIDNGTLAISNVNATGTSGAGAGTIIVKSGTTLDVQAVRLGIVQATGATAGGTGLGTMVLKDASTLTFSGESAMSSVGGQGVQFQNFTSGQASNVNINTGVAGSRFAVRNFIKNENPQSNTNTTVHLQGNGIFQLATGSLSTSPTNLQFTGTWSLEMGASGVMSVGPIISNNNTEVLQAPGFNLGAPLGETRPFIVTSGTLAVGADDKNPNVASNTTTGVFRSPVTLNGGNIASTGRKYTGTSPNATASSATPVAARYAANITTNDGTTSKVLLYDPVANGNLSGTSTLTPNPTGGRTVRFVTDPSVSSNFTWGNNSTLIADAGSETGGSLRFERTSGTVTVGTNATLQVNSGGTALLIGSVDALSDGTHHVNVVNNSSGVAGFPFGVDVVAAAGTKNVGNVSGTGALAVEGGGTAKLIANHIRQSSATINGNVQIRNQGPKGPASGASNIATLSIGPSARFDLRNNKLITNSPVGTFTGGAYTGVQGDVARAYDFGAWDLPGLMTSEPDAGPLVGTTTIGISDGATVLFLGPTETGVFAGQTVTGASTISMYTWAGDVNFDGLVDASDYGIIDNYFQFPGTTGYANGDFNYDGVIDAGDYGIIDNTFQLQGAPFDTSGVASSAASLSGVTAVPEPASLSVLAIGAAALLGRHRRREITR